MKIPPPLPSPVEGEGIMPPYLDVSTVKGEGKRKGTFSYNSL